MYQVTAIYQNSEIGYGEGETRFYALSDCANSIPAIFENEIVEFSILDNDTGETSKQRGHVYIGIDGETGVC